MDTKQIAKILRKDEIVGKQFAGVFPSDKLPTEINTPSCFVANTDPHNKPGTHWVAFFTDPDGHIEYFDSYGLHPFTKSFVTFLKRGSCGWIWNTRRIQGPLSTTCGHYCIYFLLLRCRGHRLREIIAAFDQHNLVANDITVTDFINEQFDLNTESHDIDTIVNKVCKAFGK